MAICKPQSHSLEIYGNKWKFVQTNFKKSAVYLCEKSNQSFHYFHVEAAAKYDFNRFKNRMNGVYNIDEIYRDGAGAYRGDFILIIFFVLLFFLPISSSSQHHSELNVSRLAHPEFNNENIWAITQDNSGFMWMATTSGLKRYDGRRVITFTSQIRNPASLPNMNVRAVHVASDGNLWVTTQGGGLSLFDPVSRRFKHFSPASLQVASAESSIFDFYSITEDSSGRLWLTNFPEHTVYVFNPTDESFKAISISAQSDWNFIQPQVLTIVGEELWVGTDGSGIAVLSIQGEVLQYFVAESQDESSLLSNTVQSILYDTYGRVWIGTQGGGVQLYDSSTRKFDSILNAELSQTMDSVYTIEEDESGKIWVGGNGGLIVLDPGSRVVLAHFQHDSGNTTSLTNNLIRSVFFDEGGIIWVGNQSGGVHQLKREKPFHNFTIADSKLSAQSWQNVRSIYQYSDNAMLIGAGNGDIFVFDMRTRSVIQSFLASDENTSSLTAHEATTFLAGDDGSIWFGTWGNGLRYFQPGRGLLQTFRNIRGNTESLPDNRVQMLRRSSDGTVWVGTESGLVILDAEQGTFRRVMHQPIGWPPLGYAAIQSLAFQEDENSVFWIGTWQGLFRYDHVNNHAIRYNHDIENENTLSSNQITSIYDDGKGFLWLATFGGGLNRLNKSTGDIELFTVEHGLPNNAVFALLPDDNGNLWMSTSGGLSRFNPIQKTFMNFDLDDGLDNRFFWWGSAHKADNGFMFFGHTNGFTMFHPDSISQSERIPAVELTSVRVFDQEVPFSVNKPLQLNHQQNYLTFEFAVLDFSNPDRNQYAYKMDGVNPDWVYAGTQNSVSFASLRGGEYTLRIRGANSDGVWNESGVALRIYIKPPFWQTAWFYVLVTILGVSLIVGYIRLRTRVIQARNENLELEVSRRTADLEQKQQELLRSYVELREQTELLRQTNYELEQQKEIVQLKSQELQRINEDLKTLNQEKNNLIGIVAHDLRSPLSAVVSGLQLISMQPDMPKEQLTQTVATMDGFIRKQLDMIVRILDIESLEAGNLNLKLESVDFRDIVQEELDNAAVAASGKNITMKLDMAPFALPVVADEKYLGQAVENLISNALKFSPIGSSVSVSVTSMDGRARFTIKDQGPGISDEEQKKLFGRFQKLSAKPTGGEKSIGLGLSIVKRFVEAMGGKVWCESQPGDGAAFIIELDLAEVAM